MRLVFDDEARELLARLLRNASELVESGDLCDPQSLGTVPALLCRVMEIIDEGEGGEAYSAFSESECTSISSSSDERWELALELLEGTGLEIHAVEKVVAWEYVSSSQE